MSVYESVKRASLEIKRKLFDYNISIVGREVKAIRIRQEEDIFHDFTEPEVLSAEPITVSVNFPREVPLERYRLGGKIQNAETRTYFYELIPVEIYAKLSDNMAVDDFIFFFMEDDQKNKIPFLFQITDVFGRFEIGMIWKKFYVAPYNGSDIEKIIPYLENYVISKEYDQFKEETPDSKYLLDQEDEIDYVHSAYKNLFHQPLNPKDQTITINKPTTIQCAFGYIDVLGERIVTPTEPLLIVPEEEMTLQLVVSSDCKFPSIYESDVLRPFTLDKRDAFALKGLFTADLTGDFTIDLSFMKKTETSPIVFIDSQGSFIDETFSVLGDLGIQQFRPIFYVEDSSGSFVSVRVTSDYQLELTAKTLGNTSSHVFGNVEDLDLTSFQFSVEGGVLEIFAIDNSFSVDGAESFVGKNFYLGFEPDRYLNDFIRQIYL